MNLERIDFIKIGIVFSGFITGHGFIRYSYIHFWAIGLVSQGKKSFESKKESLALYYSLYFTLDGTNIRFWGFRKKLRKIQGTRKVFIRFLVIFDSYLRIILYRPLYMVHIICWFRHGMYHTLYFIWVAHILCQVRSKETLKVNIGLVWMTILKISLRLGFSQLVQLVYIRSVWSVFGSETYLTY